MIVPGFSQRVLERQRVEDGREHPHVVGGRAVHPGGGALHAAVDVAGADDDRDLDALVAHGADLPRDAGDALGVGAVVELPHQRLAGELQQDAFEDGRHLGREPR